ncbi:substrate-binding domain-containing protein [Actinomadura viridis]|uniref:vWA domain-containing protein n=1 Tax=Actinomadura viridis TaxID=58110 RepID=UPI0036806CC0
MTSSTEPEHRTIFWVDIANSSAPDRSDWDRREAREGLYNALLVAFRRARLPWPSQYNRSKVHHEDRGDGAFWLVHATIPKNRLMAALPHLVNALAEHNRSASKGASIALRVALHAGEVTFDPHGVSGTAMDYTARLLDAPEFKRMFAESGPLLGVIASDAVYQGVIRPNPHHKPLEYRRLAVDVRGTGPPVAQVRLFSVAASPSGATGHWKRPYLPRPPRPVRAALALTALTVPLTVAPGETPPAACQSPPVQIRVRVSTEKEPIIRTLAQEFESGYRSLDGCRRADVNIVSASYPGGAREALHQGWLTRDPKEVLHEADVWLPDSSLEVEQVREALRVNRITTVGLDGSRGSITTSRLVVAVPDAMADRLELSGHTITWQDVLGWTRKGYAFGRASPRASSVGLASTVALYQAALNTTKLDEQALTKGDAASRLHTVEQAIAREDDEPGKLLCAMRGSPPDGDLRETALLVSEKSLIDYRANAPLGGDACAPGDPAAQPRLRPFYVEEGMPVFDHPFVVITRTPPPATERMKIINAFYERLRGPDVQARLKAAGYRDASGGTSPQQDDIPSLLRAVDLSGTFLDEPLLEAWNKARKSAQVLFAVDVSRAMAAPFPYSKGTRAAAAADAIALARPLMGARDEIGLWRFADGIGARDRSLVSVGPPDPGRIDRLTDRLNGLRPTADGGDLYPAIAAGVQEMRSHGGGSRPDESTRAVIVITDGAGSGAPEAAELADDLSAGPPVRVYAIAFHSDSCAAGLDQVTRAAGGICYEIDGMSAMRRALDGIATSLWGTPP